MKFLCQDISELPAIAAKICDAFKPHKIILFKGEMGAGKTTLIKEICKSLGVEGLVSSPTFSLVNEYKTSGGEIIFHFDFYRIKNLQEVYDMGYEEYFFSGSYCFIEWPEMIEPLINFSHAFVQLKVKDEIREIILNT